LALSLHSSNEPSELSQWPWHKDSTINIDISIIILLLLATTPHTSNTILKLNYSNTVSFISFAKHVQASTFFHMQINIQMSLKWLQGYFIVLGLTDVLGCPNSTSSISMISAFREVPGQPL